MKKFIFNIITFLCIIIVFNGIVYLFAYTNYYKVYAIEPDKKFHSFLFSDSHGLPLGKYAEYYSVYNFSAGSESYFDMERKLEYLIKNNYDVDTVYISVDDHMLSHYRDNNNNTDRSVFYLSKRNTDTYTYFESKYLKYYFVILQPKVRTIFRLFLFKKAASVIHSEFKKQEEWATLSLDEKEQESQERKHYQFSGQKSSEKLAKSLEHIISLSKKHNITLLGIKYPLSKTYLNALGNSNFGADEIFKANGIKVLDYKRIFSDKDEYFGNQDHLNKVGGKEFSKILFRE